MQLPLTALTPLIHRSLQGKAACVRIEVLEGSHVGNAGRVRQQVGLGDGEERDNCETARTGGEVIRPDVHGIGVEPECVVVAEPRVGREADTLPGAGRIVAVGASEQHFVSGAGCRDFASKPAPACVVEQNARITQVDRMIKPLATRVFC